jgi:ribosomal protein L31E
MSSEQKTTYVLNLRVAKFAPRYRRTERMISAIRNQVARYTKTKPSEIKISERLNNLIWSRGGRGYFPKIRVVAEKDEDNIITVKLPEEIQVMEAKTSNMKAETEAKDTSGSVINDSKPSEELPKIVDAAPESGSSIKQNPET